MTVLEKIKILERYVAIDPSMIDPVMERAIDKLLELDGHLRGSTGIVREESRADVEL